MRLNRNLWPGRNAWVSETSAHESRASRHMRRAEREAAILRRRHFHEGIERVRRLLDRLLRRG